jgi:hypothetical protein
MITTSSARAAENDNFDKNAYNSYNGLFEVIALDRGDSSLYLALKFVHI